MPVILGANSASGGYNITNSLRFNSGSSDYLNRTPASAGNQKTMTISFWTKRSTLSSGADLISQGSGSACHINFDGSNQIELNLRNSVDGASNVFLITSQLFRDVSAWYHIVLALDTTQSTNTNRVKLYVNGTQVTAFSTTTYPSQNGNLFFNEASAINIGRSVSTGSDYNGYLSEIYFIDGQALTPSSFGETDEDTGIWKPKAYTGTYGTNGFYLQFKNSSSLGTDSSGNGNTFTVNNLTSIDQTTDTPTNNFCTLNPLNNGGLTISEGNTKATGVGTHYAITSTMAVDKGKWYWEVKNGTDAGGNAFGIMGTESKLSDQLNAIPSIWSRSSGNKFKDSVDGGSYMSFANGDIIGVALDMDNGTIVFYKNGVSQGTAYSSINNGTIYSPALKFNTSGDNATINFGNPPYSANSYADANGYGNFSYQVPANYLALCTKNLATNG